jgi:hypothetical protein
MAFAQATLVKRIRARLGEVEWHDICTEAMDATEVGLDVADTTKWSIGEVVEFQDDGELCLVTAIPGGTTLTVIRNYQLSVTATPGTGTTHSINADIVKDPHFRYSAIIQAIDATIGDLWPHVGAAEVTTITPVAGVRYYSVAAVIEALSSAEQHAVGSIAKAQFYGGKRSAYPIELVRGIGDNFPTTEDTGKAVWIPRLYNTTNTIKVIGVRPVTNAISGGNYTDLTDGVQVECVMYLTISELLAATDVPRLTSEDTSMHDASVTPGRRSFVADDIWHRRGVQARARWRRDLRTSLPRLGSYQRPF